jgi:diguanylate cyclase (GGDEF)-like protein/PAS domain S-box-containing protein
MRYLDSIVDLLTGSIRRQLALAFALSTCIVMIAYGVRQHQSKFLSEQSVRSAQDLAHSVAVGSTAWVVANDVIGLQAELNSVARYTNLRYALVLTREGKVLASNRIQDVGKVVQDPVSLRMLASAQAAPMILIDDASLVDAAEPVFAGKLHVGWVRIGWGREQVARNLADVTLRGLQLGVAGVLFALLLAVLISGRLTSGLRELMALTDAVHKGERKMRARLGRADDIGRLAASVNGMLEALATSERELAQRNNELRVAEERWRFALEGSGDGLWDRNVKTGETFFSKRWKEMLGLDDADMALIGDCWENLVHPDDIAGVLEDLDRKLRREPGAHASTVEFRIRCKDGAWKWLLGHGMIVSEDQSGRALRLVGTHTDINSRKANEEEIKSLAFYDPLTRLPNRRLLHERLRHALAAAARSGRAGALLFIDLDNFKTLNDTLGHDMGDLLLQQVADRLAHCVREGDTVARLGGDEFVVMLETLDANLDDAASQAETIGRKVLHMLNAPYALAGRPYQTTSSIGVALFRDHQHSIDELMKRADMAMYVAKTGGRNTLRFFDPRMQTVVSERAALEQDLRDGLARGEFELYYQSQRDAADNVIGAEALLRWHHPLRGLVPPNDFIALTEETGLIIPIGQWVLERACDQLVAWSAAPDKAQLTIAINISVRQFRQADFVASVLSALAASGANPTRLKLELTESLLMEDVEDIIARMTALKEYGIGFSLDDFGTGYSSLSCLKRLPLEHIKIDRSFVRDLPQDASDAAIASTILALAHHMGMQVIAEGVETEAQRSFLAARGCQAFQGYLFGRPQPIALFEREQLMPAVVD